MKIQQATENQLILTTNPITKFIYFSEKWLPLLVAVVFVAFLVNFEYLENLFSYFPAELCWFTLAIPVVYLVLVILRRKFSVAITYIFDKSQGNLHVKTQILDWASNRSYAIADFDRVTLARMNKRSILGVKLDTGAKVWLNQSSFQVAETLGKFLDLPFEFELDGEKIIQVPSRYQTPSMLALSCPQCGGQLPLIQPEETQVRCEFCGTGSRIVWDSAG